MKRGPLLLALATALLSGGALSGCGTPVYVSGGYYNGPHWWDYGPGWYDPYYNRPWCPGCNRPDRPERPERPERPPHVRPPIARPPAARPPVARPPVARPPSIPSRPRPTPRPAMRR